MTRSQLIARDIRTLERHLCGLLGMRTDLGAFIVVEGPGTIGRNALAKHGVADRISTLITDYESAIHELAAAHAAAEIAECTAQLWTMTGEARANMRWYLRDLIGASRNAKELVV